MRYLITLLFMMSSCVFANYFYMDKTYSDILISHPITGALNVAPFAFTSEQVKTPEGHKVFEILYPKSVLTFSDNEQFNYIIQIGPRESNSLSGKWKVEDSTLIFTFDNNDYEPLYKFGTQIRYYIVKVKDPSSSSLVFEALNFPDDIGIIAGSDSPLDDFKKIYTELEIARNLKK